MINTFQIFENTFHSADIRGRGYLITFWITNLIYTRKENWTSNEAVNFYIFYIASLWWCIDAKRNTWFTRGGSISAFSFLLLYWWSLCCKILLLNISLKYYSNGTLIGCIFEPVSFVVSMGNCHWKSQISNVTQNVHSWKSCGHFSMKRFPLHLWQERSFLCYGENTEFRFEWLITCPKTRKKEVKRLLTDWRTSI